MLLTLLMTLQVLLIQSNPSDIQITTLKNPILPIELGKTKLIYNKHTFLYYVDLDLVLKQLKNIKNYFSIIKKQLKYENVTNPLSYHGLSENAVLRTEYLIQVTQNKLGNLYPHIRNKRGLINIVGKANKWLFGTLDSDDGIRYDETIKRLENNQQNLIDEINLQVSLSKNLIDNYNKTISVLSGNQKKLEYSLELFKTEVGKYINNLSSYITFQGILSQINLDCQNLITFIDNLEDAIMFAKLNALHNSILSSSELGQMLSYLKTIYNSAEIPNFKNVLSFYQFLGTQVTFSKTKVVFAIHFPIVKPEDFTFYHIYPIVQNHKTFLPKYPYLARTKEETQFEETLCPSLEEKYYCIENFHPSDNCTLQLLEGFPLTDCPVLEVNTKEPIMEQITQEEILIIPFKEEKILSKCYKDQYIKIHAPTLLKVPKNCQVQIGSKVFINDLQIKQGKPFILPEIDMQNHKTLISYKTPNLTKLNFEDMYRLKDMANQLSHITLANQPITTSQWIGHVIIGITVATLLLALIWKYKPNMIAISRKLRRKKINGEINKTNTSENTAGIFEA